MMASPAVAPDLASKRSMIDTLRACTHDVFGTMVGIPLGDGAPQASDAPHPRSNVVGQIGFGGTRSGLVVFHATFAGAATITRSLLAMGEADQPSRNDIADAIGEITNMVAGSFRTRMASEGDAWAISIPTVTTGSDFCITPPADGRRVMLPFSMADHEIFVELVLTGREPRP